MMIIGAGVAGLSAAYALASQNIDVSVADGGHGGQSSWAGAGIVCPLMPWNYGEEVNRLALAGMRAWPQWAAALGEKSGIDPEFWACGMEVVVEDKTYPLPTSPLAEKGLGGVNPGTIQDILAWCQSHSLAIQPMEGRRIFLPGVAQVRNPRLLDALTGSVKTLGGDILQNCKIDGLKSQGRTVTSVISGANEHRADAFVLATGAWSGLPLGQFAALPNIRPVRGQMLLYAPGSHTLGHILYRDGIYLVPRRDGHLLAGSTLEHVGFNAQTTADALASLHQAACDLLPELRGHSPIKSWAGLRPGSPDNLPLIDRHPDFDNLWIHTGHFRYGVTMAPASSRLLVELMLGEVSSPDPTPYSWQAALERHWPNEKPC